MLRRWALDSGTGKCKWRREAGEFTNSAETWGRLINAKSGGEVVGVVRKVCCSGVVSPLHPDKSPLEPVGFPNFFVDTLDEFLDSLFPLFSLWLRLGHDACSLNLLFPWLPLIITHYNA